MRSILFVLALAAVAACPLQAQGRLALPVPLAGDKDTITTSIDDALPVATHLEGIDGLTPLPLPASFEFGPGYYRGDVRSYCLHAGTYGPTSGDGYLVAPLKGSHADIISGILARSAQHPEIERSVVQRLVWAVESGTSWNDYDAAFRQRVRPLLTEQDIRRLGTDPVRREVAGKLRAGLGRLIPGRAKEVLAEASEWQRRLTSPDLPFEELERAGVLNGDVPWGKGSRKDVGPGNWAYVGNGFYLRTFPKGYTRTTLEIFRTGTADITRDALGRITRFDSDGYIIDTRYAAGDTPSTVDGRPAWRFTEVTFRHPDGRTRTFRDRGHVFASLPGGGPLVPQMAMLQVFLGGPPKGDLGDLEHYREGLESATDPGDFKGRGEWLLEHFNRVKAAWQAAADALRGNTGEPPPDAAKRPFDPSRHVAAPANTARQRLGLSPVPY
ncbi:hypothetical protein [Cognatiluteimonas lumbrici]|uniref:hypothetical protein n=1 Tax=Cognatiluteimonas lumbrici TaxID=2559601 RepID=UPI00112CDE70|nr:hypothetical protein [Luteimonas lumbrici]